MLQRRIAGRIGHHAQRAAPKIDPADRARRAVGLVEGIALVGGIGQQDAAGQVVGTDAESESAGAVGRRRAEQGAVVEEIDGHVGCVGHAAVGEGRSAERIERSNRSSTSASAEQLRQRGAAVGGPDGSEIPGRRHALDVSLRHQLGRGRARHARIRSAAHPAGRGGDS